jgi:trans-aconitate 2-methyltransferase
MLQLPTDPPPREVWDLGCGTGEHAAVLAARHPGSVVHGLDASPEMLARARQRTASVDWQEGDIANWSPRNAPDLIFTNAVLQWLPNHARLIPELVGKLAHGGAFACQVPLSYGERWHMILREAAASGPWARKLEAVQGVNPTPPAEDYYRWLSPLCRDVDIWSTTYLHVLEGEDPVVDWMSGTALRPYAQALEGEEQAAFLEDYRQRISAAFPKEADGTTLFPFPRLFIVARRS